MSVTNGQAANQTTFNDAFVSKSANSTMTGVLTLNNGSSGGNIANVQQKINDVVSHNSTQDTSITSLESRVSDLEDAAPIATSHSFTAGQAATDLTGETFDSAVFSSVEIVFEVVRGTAIMANGRIWLQYFNSAWRVQESAYDGEDHGLTWSVSGTTTAQLRLAANAGDNGTLKLKKTYFDV